jgi:hypothetical protein
MAQPGSLLAPPQRYGDRPPGMIGGSGLRLSGRTPSEQAIDVSQAERIDHEVNGHVDDQRKERLAAGQRWRDRVLRSQNSVDYPGLTANLGRVPAAEHGDEAGRKR